MTNKVNVTGKSQNRTALGIVHAYVKMNPGCTVNSLREALPNDVCPDAGVKELFLPVREAETFNAKMGLYFTKPGETITLADGSIIALAQVWSKASLDRISAKAADYGITIANIDKGITTPNGFILECINGYTFPKAKKGCLGLLLLPIIAAGALSVLWIF